MSTPDINQLVATWHDLEARRVELVEAQEQIKHQLREHLDVGRHETDAGTVTLSVNRRFDPTLAATVLEKINPDLVAACSVTKVDSSATKRLVGGDVYERCMAEVGAARVSIS